MDEKPAKVALLGTVGDDGAWYRNHQTVDGWHDHDLSGQQLKASELSSRLTLVAGFQQTSRL